MKSSTKEAIYNSEVLTRFELYNSLFQTLPFYQVKHTGRLLPFFASHVEQSIQDKLNPEDIIESFFGQYEQYVQVSDRMDLLFRIIQYIERQVVLFDAVEDAAFLKTGRADDAGLLDDYLKLTDSNSEFRNQVLDKLKDFSLRLVLTAHPTQFYPGEVLAIINDLTHALKENDINTINLLLQQLGKTPFLRLAKPTPVDEARSLAWFLEHVFYHAASDIQRTIDETFDISPEDERQIIELGFWPGGDRDGNPNVSVESTKEVSALLRTILFRCYYRDFRILKRRITFKGVEKYMARLQDLFYENSFNPSDKPQDVKEEIIDNLEEIKRVIRDYHDSLFINIVDDLLRKVKIFGNYFASLDIRQDSSVLRETFAYLSEKYPEETTIKANFFDLPEEDKVKAIQFNELDLSFGDDADPLVKDTIATIRYVKDIQSAGGTKACHRFIISNCQQASDILELMQLFLWCGWKQDELYVDFVPLFETVDDLERAEDVMRTLYSHKTYAAHLAFLGNGQTIMLGFSDSTKDGGYLMANWSIYRAKIDLTSISREFDVDLTFFDGRGGPPARGGGKTHNFYASMGEEIANNHIQLTIQGQTISSQYGSFDSARFNIEQLLHAGIASAMHKNPGDTLDSEEKELIDKMAHYSHQKFMSLRHDPLFLRYLEELSPLKFLSSINISSRPVKRNSEAKLRLEDLRAISFVTAWSQLKQSVPGFYGLGTALQQADKDGRWDEVARLYHSSGMFRTIIDNSIMAMSKSNFDITSYLEKDAEFGNFYVMLRDEFYLTKEYVLRLSDSKVLMEKYPIERKSISIREKIIQPLVIIQHYAIKMLHKTENSDPQYEVLSKLLTRTVYGIVNAGRNLV
ncbi:phosphoenolpyruvate carboxylase [Olivibacter sitiensis]|uniref:phosphoenolpyruvate carboxylase n=1 Tax=Olivibacter sitiensis TaxID=376470 RepID=UPI0004251A6C|nr:phosphoenolpyruvate carboxylase [Olivibacter sitiensis]